MDFRQSVMPKRHFWGMVTRLRHGIGKMRDRSPHAAVIVIGDEILSGRTQDANLTTIARFLADLGIPLAEARVVADQPDAIIAAVNSLRRQYRYVFTTGGIGPTHDDITADSIGAAFGLEVLQHPDAVARLRAHYGESELSEARLRMARMPKGAQLIDNPVSKAPGFYLENVFVLAGIPRLVEVMLESVRPLLTGGPPLRSLTVSAHLPESRIAEGLGRIAARYAAVQIGSYPFYKEKKYGTSLVVRGTDERLLKQVAGEIAQLVRELGADPIKGDMS
jgi:molybdenum cofactor synthesis domain-containing protein